MTTDGSLRLTNVRLPSDPAVATELLIEDSEVADPSAAGADDLQEVDGRGLLALPGFADGHAHVDKTLWGLPWRSYTGGDTLSSLIENERTVRTTLPPVRERAGNLLASYLDRGTTRIRTHVDVDPAIGIGSVAGVLAAAAELDGAIEVEVVAFPQSGLLSRPGTAELMDSALSSGASIVGGIDPAGLDGDGDGHLNVVFDLAERHQCPIDIHLHDRGDDGRRQVAMIIDRVRALSMQGEVTISHAFCLGDDDPAVGPLLDQLAEERIGLATVAPGRADPLPLGALVERGIPLRLGQDGIRDLWSPWGDADMLARARLLAWRSGLRDDAGLELCLRAATGHLATPETSSDPLLAPGTRGDVVLVDAENAAHAVVTAPARQLVISSGHTVAGR